MANTQADNTWAGDLQPMHVASDAFSGSDDPQPHAARKDSIASTGGSTCAGPQSTGSGPGPESETGSLQASSESEQDSTSTGPRLEDSRRLSIKRGHCGVFAGDCVIVFWPVAAQKLQGKDKQIVSPTFELLPDIAFRLMVKAKAIGEGKGQASFRKAKGRGYIELKCEASSSVCVPPMRFCLSLASGGQTRPPCGPVSHAFADTPVCSLPEFVWDFDSAVESASMTFAVRLEVQALRNSHEEP